MLILMRRVSANGSFNAYYAVRSEWPIESTRDSAKRPDFFISSILYVGILRFFTLLYTIRRH